MSIKLTGELSSIFEEGGWIIRQTQNKAEFVVYEIPGYGGEERILESFTDFFDALNYAQKLT